MSHKMFYKKKHFIWIQLTNAEIILILYESHESSSLVKLFKHKKVQQSSEQYSMYRRVQYVQMSTELFTLYRRVQNSTRQDGPKNRDLGFSALFSF